MASVGLPRYVVSFLRQMEAHKDYLKWNITEGSHKITLALCWNFRKHKGKESLWDKVQRTLRLSRSQDDEASIPPNLSRFLEETSPRPEVRTYSGGPSAAAARRLGSLRRQLSWSRLSTFSLPARLRHLHGGGRNAVPRDLPSIQRTSPAHASMPCSPSRYSWPGTGLGRPRTPSLSLDLSEQMLPSHSTITSTPNSTRSDISPGPRSNRSKVIYRTEEDIERSLEDIIERTRERALEELESIRKEWNESIRTWPQFLKDEETLGFNTSSERTDSDSEPNLQVVNETVQKCIDSCDKILSGSSATHSSCVTTPRASISTAAEAGAAEAPHTADNPHRYTPDNTLRHTPDNTLRHTSDNTLRHTPDNTLRHTPDNTLRHTPDNTLRHTPDNTLRHTPDNPRRHTPDNTYRHTPDNTYRHTPDNNTLGYTDNTSTEPWSHPHAVVTRSKPTHNLHRQDSFTDNTPIINPADTTPHVTQQTHDTPPPWAPENHPVMPTEYTHITPTECIPISPTDSTPILLTDSTPISQTDSTTISQTDSTTISQTDSTPISPTDNTPILLTDSTRVSPTEYIHIIATESIPLSPTSSIPLSPTDSIPLSPTDSITLFPKDNISTSPTCITPITPIEITPPTPTCITPVTPTDLTPSTPTDTTPVPPTDITPQQPTHTLVPTNFTPLSHLTPADNTHASQTGNATTPIPATENTSPTTSAKSESHKATLRPENAVTQRQTAGDGKPTTFKCTEV